MEIIAAIIDLLFATCLRKVVACFAEKIPANDPIEFFWRPSGVFQRQPEVRIHFTDADESNSRPRARSLVQFGTLGSIKNVSAFSDRH